MVNASQSKVRDLGAYDVIEVQNKGKKTQILLLQTKNTKLSKANLNPYIRKSSFQLERSFFITLLMFHSFIRLLFLNHHVLISHKENEYEC